MNSHACGKLSYSHMADNNFIVQPKLVRKQEHLTHAQSNLIVNIEGNIHDQDT